VEEEEEEEEVRENVFLFVPAPFYH